MCNRCVVVALSIATLASGRARAQSEERGMEGILSLLEEERVTSASRFEQKASESPSSITVITADQIAISGARELRDLLRLVPGLDLVNITEPYSAASIRGFNDESNTSLLLLLDGMKVNIEFGGSPLFDALPVPIEEIDRIEVIRGPGSAVWGQNAYMGVINIITKDPRSSTGGYATARGGSFGSAIATARYGAAWSKVGFRAYASHDQIDDRADRDEQGRGSNRGGATLVGGEPGESAWRVDAMADNSHGTIFSTIGEVVTAAEQDFLRASYGYRGFTAQAFWTRIDLDFQFRLPGIIPDLFPTLRRILGVGNTYDVELVYEKETKSDRPLLDGHHLSAGASYRLNAMESDVIVGHHSDERLSGIFAQDAWRIGEKWAITAGARYDTNSINESAFSPRLAVNFSPGSGSTWRASVGRAFRNPAYIENQIDLTALHTVFPEGSISNPDLRNEEVTSFEVAYGYRSRRRWNLGANLFYNQVRDFVSFDVNLPPDATYGRYVNLPDGFEAWGGEVEVELAASDYVELFGNIAWLDMTENARDPSVDDNNPTTHALAGVRVRRKPFLGSATAAYVSPRTFAIQDPNVGLLGGALGGRSFVPKHIDSFVLVNAYAAVQLWRQRLQLYASGWNLLDQDAQEFPSIPWDSDKDPSTPPENFGGEPNPRQFGVGVRLTF